MAIWQFKLVCVPEKVLLDKYKVLPLFIPQDLAEGFAWWSNAQPPRGVEQDISAILPEMPAWSTSMRLWGKTEGHDAHVFYLDETKTMIEEIAFRIDVGAPTPSLIRKICGLAKKLACVFITSKYRVLPPDESVVLAEINRSTAKGYLEDPVSTLLRIKRSGEFDPLDSVPVDEEDDTKFS
jgi:hypothetical protein